MEPIEALQVSSGLSLSQLALLFGVSQRTVELWRRGGAMAPCHERILQAALHVVSQLGCNSPEQCNRRLFVLGAGAGARSLFEQLRAGTMPLRRPLELLSCQ